MTTDTPAAAAITAERIILAFGEGPWHVEHRTNAASDICDSRGRTVASCAWYEDARRRAELLCDMLNSTLSAPVAAQPAASGVDALWVHRLRETAAHLRGNSLSLAKYPGMGDEARARELAALYIGEIAELYALKAHLSTALTGAAKE